MTVRLIPPSDKGPIDDEARAMLERILRDARPLAIGFVYEGINKTDFEAVPALQCVRDGLGVLIRDMTSDGSQG